jgi:hypothetical protein
MAKPKLEPTVTIGGAPAGYKPKKTATAARAKYRTLLLV